MFFLSLFYTFLLIFFFRLAEPYEDRGHPRNKPVKYFKILRLFVKKGHSSVSFFFFFSLYFFTTLAAILFNASYNISPYSNHLNPSGIL